MKTRDKTRGEKSGSARRECSDRRRRGRSIKRMMMQAHVKSLDGLHACVSTGGGVQFNILK